MNRDYDFKVGDAVRRHNLGKVNSGNGVVVRVVEHTPASESEITVQWEHGKGTYRAKYLMGRNKKE